LRSRRPSHETIEFRQLGRKTGDAGAADQWVSKGEGRQRPSEPMRRSTIDVPASLHARIKARCALWGTKMADELRLLLKREYPPMEGEES
jgi:hypothetical protein